MREPIRARHPVVADHHEVRAGALGEREQTAEHPVHLGEDARQNRSQGSGERRGMGGQPFIERAVEQVSRFVGDREIEGDEAPAGQRSGGLEVREGGICDRPGDLEEPRFGRPVSALGPDPAEPPGGVLGGSDGPRPERLAETLAPCLPGMDGDLAGPAAEDREPRRPAPIRRCGGEDAQLELHPAIPCFRADRAREPSLSADSDPGQKHRRCRRVREHGEAVPAPLRILRIVEEHPDKAAVRDLEAEEGGALRESAWSRRGRRTGEQRIPLFVQGFRREADAPVPGEQEKALALVVPERPERRRERKGVGGVEGDGAASGPDYPDPQGIGAQHLGRKSVPRIEERMILRRQGENRVSGHPGVPAGEPGPEHGERRGRLRRERGHHPVRKRPFVAEAGEIRKRPFPQESLDQLVPAPVHRKHQQTRLFPERPFAGCGESPSCADAARSAAGEGPPTPRERAERIAQAIRAAILWGRRPAYARTMGFPISVRTDSHAGRFVHRLFGRPGGKRHREQNRRRPHAGNPTRNRRTPRGGHATNRRRDPQRPGHRAAGLPRPSRPPVNDPSTGAAAGRRRRTHSRQGGKSERVSPFRIGRSRIGTPCRPRERSVEDLSPTDDCGRSSDSRRAAPGGTGQRARRPKSPAAPLPQATSAPPPVRPTCRATMEFVRQETFTSSAKTHGIRVDVEARFADRRREPKPAWLFQYDIEITNESKDLVRLLSRHWVIEHGADDIEEVRGPGVVGARPYLVPGESFHYTSWCPLRAPFGSMRGTYLMEIPGGERFEVEIAPFTLSPPVTLH